MRTEQQIALIILNITLVILCTACTGSALKPEAALWGNWTYAGGQGGSLDYATDLHFQEDGVLTLLDRPQFQAAYVVIAPGRMKVTVGGSDEVLNYRLEEDTLTLYFEDGHNTYTHATETWPNARGEPMEQPLASTPTAQGLIEDIIEQEIDDDDSGESWGLPDSEQNNLPTQTVAAATATPTFGLTATQIPVSETRLIDKTNPQAIFEWVKQAIDIGDATLVEDLISEDGVWYNDSKMESSGIVLKSRQAFLQDFQNNLATQPVCEGVHLDEQVLVIWYKNWKPGWDPSLMDPRNAGFLFTKESSVYQLTDLLIYSPVHYFNYSPVAPYMIYSLISCDSDDVNNPTFVPSCPGSLPQRLQVGDRGRVCTQKDSVRLRVRPGTDGAVRLVLPPDTTFEVIDGPECAGSNWSWWQVRLDDGQVGWMAEGGDEEDVYFLCPLD
jgi:hypothetical protein